jgi:hypothetical protein
MISDFCCSENEICALLEYFGAENPGRSQTSICRIYVMHMK